MQRELSQLREDERTLIRDKRLRNDMEIESVSAQKKSKRKKNATAQFVRYACYIFQLPIFESLLITCL